MLFERYDLMSPIRNFYFQLMDKAIEPMWESQSDTWIYTELAKRLGIHQETSKPPVPKITLRLKEIPR